MGVVYKARQTTLDRLVALKTLRNPEQAGADHVARFRREAEAIARLRHPNVIQIYAIGEHEGLSFFAMEYATGGSLERRLSGRPLPEHQAAQVIRILARAAHAAHQAGIVHRDLKPANILLQSPQGEPAPNQTCLMFGERLLPKITDFGLARLIDRSTAQTQTGDIFGTASYMAPEQAQGKGKDSTPATDVYALGAILYELLTGRPPFQAATYLDTLIQVLTEQPPPLRLSLPKLARDLETICLKCLHKEPTKRYASAADLAADLDHFLAGEPIRGRPVGLVEELILLRRHKPLIGFILLFFAVFVALMGVGGLAGISKGDPKQTAASALISGYFTFAVGLLVAVRPRVWGFAFAGLTMPAAAGAGWLTGGDLRLSLVGTATGAGIAAWLGGVAQVTARRWGCSALESLAGVLVGGFCFSILVFLLTLYYQWITGSWLVVVRAVSFAMGTILGGTAVSAWLARLGRSQSGLQEEAQSLASIPSRQLPSPPQPLPSPVSAEDGVAPEAGESLPDTGPFEGVISRSTPIYPPEKAGCPLPQVRGYEVEGVLGEGGMAIVYRARQVAADRLVALKMIRTEGHDVPMLWERFHREARAAARLRHPNIIQVYEFGESAGQPFLALEFMAGGSLADKLQGRPSSPRPAAEMVRTLARAVHEAHQQGVLHRDLKPHNVLLDTDGTPKIGDFGLARLVDDRDGLTRTGDILGTPVYMAPEQSEGRIRDIGPTTDVYALGGILYHLLTGRPPIQAANRLAALEQVRTKPPLPPRRFQPECPRDLEAVCLKCLEKDSSRRYADAADLADDLERFLAGEPTRVRPPAFWRRALAARVRVRSGSAESASFGELLVVWLVLTPILIWRFVRRDSGWPEAALLAAIFGYAFWKTRQLPRKPVLSQETPWDEAAPVASVRRRRGEWVTFPLAHLHFPPVCCACGRPTNYALSWRVGNRTHGFELIVPTCPDCQAGLSRRRRLGLSWGAVIGGLTLPLLAVPYAAYRELSHRDVLACFYVAAALFGATVGAVLGLAVARRLPLRWRRYSWKKGTLDLRFRRREYANLILVYIDRQALT
jgi:serine/threonine protein kinase